jgi:hypothetical protein
MPWPLSDVSGSVHFARGTKVDVTVASSSSTMPSAAAQDAPTKPPLLSPALTSASYVDLSAAVPKSSSAALAIVPKSVVPTFPVRKVRAPGSSPK